MITGVLIFVILIVGGAIFVARALRGEVFDVAQKSRRLRDPATSTLAYAIPNGVDPSAVMAPLAMAGFESVVVDTGARDQLLIGCAPAQRERLRDVIREVHLTNYDGTAYESGRVVFEDERAAS